MEYTASVQQGIPVGVAGAEMIQQKANARLAQLRASSTTFAPAPAPTSTSPPTTDHPLRHNGNSQSTGPGSTGPTEPYHNRGQDDNHDIHGPYENAGYNHQTYASGGGRPYVGYDRSAMGYPGLRSAGGLAGPSVRGPPYPQNYEGPFSAPYTVYPACRVYGTPACSPVPIPVYNPYQPVSAPVYYPW